MDRKPNLFSIDNDMLSQFFNNDVSEGQYGGSGIGGTSPYQNLMESNEIRP